MRLRCVYVVDKRWVVNVHDQGSVKFKVIIPLRERTAIDLTAGVKTSSFETSGQKGGILLLGKAADVFNARSATGPRPFGMDDDTLKTLNKVTGAGFRLRTSGLAYEKEDGHTEKDVSVAKKAAGSS